MSRTYASSTKLGWCVTQAKVIIRFKAIQSVTATAIKREENLHRFLPPLQRKCAGCVSPNVYKMESIRL